MIIFNQKFYNDYLHRNIIKLLFIDNDDNLSINLFRKMITTIQYNQLKKIVQTNILLIDISNKLTWFNISKKLNYLNVFYKNTDIIYYH
jgi:ferric iron reductase protein FhuF